MRSQEHFPKKWEPVFRPGSAPALESEPFPASQFCLAGKGLSYDIAVHLGDDAMPAPRRPPRGGRKGTDRKMTGRLQTDLELWTLRAGRAQP